MTNKDPRVFNATSSSGKTGASLLHKQAPWARLSLRGRLFVLACATVIPLALFAVVAFVAVLHQQRHQVEQSTLAMARALSNSLSGRLLRTVAALEAYSLAQDLSQLDEDDLHRAYSAARHLRISRADWRGMLLARPDGTVLFGSESPLSSPPPKVAEMGSLSEVVRLQAPVVGPLTRGQRGNVGYTVRIPVIRQGEVRYVLTAIVGAEAMLEVIQQQQLPENWIASVFDSQLRRVARSKDNGLHFGAPPSPTLAAMIGTMGEKQEVVGTTSTVEGDEAFTAVSRIAGTAWTIAVGTHTAPQHEAAWRASLLYLAGLTLSLGLGCFAFWTVARGITSRAERLRENAAALGRGSLVDKPHEGIPEFDTVALALWEASQLRAQAESEREHLLQLETQARTVAEDAQKRLQLLLSATSSISHSQDEKRALTAIASAIVPGVADICRIDLVGHDGKLERKLTFHKDPAQVEKIDAIVHSGHVSSQTPGSMPWVIAHGREYVQTFDQDKLEEIEDPLFRRFVEVTGMTAVCLVPLIARDRVIGAMAALQAGSGREFGADDVSLLCELGSRAALALENLRLYSDCTSALEKAKEAGKAKDDFLAMLGHELRNPLSPILTALELIKRRDPAAFVHEREIIERQARHMSVLVDDLLDVSRIAAGKLQLHRERIDLRAVVERAIELTAPLYANRNAPIVQDAQTRLLVHGDLPRLAQVVANLLNNAVKFSARDSEIRIGLLQQEEWAVISVEDEGVGIPADLLPRVFDRFVQSPQKLQRPKGGLGLGLTIARSIVEAHGGTIDAGPGRQGRGASIAVRLPLLVPAPAHIPSSNAGDKAARPLRVLVVDDNQDAADILAILLRHAGHEVSSVASAEECLQIVDEVKPDVCILDIGLPGMSGYELARRLRSNRSTQAIYLLAITGYGQYADRQQAFDAGFDEHLTKPVDIDLLEPLLRKVQPH